jgi:hypothetical protein
LGTSRDIDRPYRKETAMKWKLIYLTLFTMLLSACLPPANPELGRNREKWRAASISHYRFSLFVGCFCPFTQRMPLTIEVREGRVVSMTYSDGAAVPDADRPMYAQYETIDALFSFVRDAISRADEIHIAYDPDHGFPSSVQIDFIKNAMDDELALNVQSFETLP